MNTSNLRPPVGQLDKSGIFPLKTSNNEALPVGRHQDKSPRTSERTHKGAPAPDFMEQSDYEKQDLTAMLHLHNLFSDLLPQTKVVFHNVLYVEQIQEGFLPHEADIFLQFVKTFALFRHSHNPDQLSGILLTNDQDFYLALKLMQKRKLSDYTDIKPKNRTKILDLIRLKFQNRAFTPKIIAQELFYNYAFIHRILAMLILEREIEFVKGIGGESVYRLREKPVVNVTCR